MSQADTALHQVKAEGRNNLKFYLPSMKQSVNERLQWASDLRCSIENKDFLLHFQPQVDANRRIIGAEALVRWQHPTQGLVMPDKFVPLAEESGLILGLGDVVFKLALKALHTWVSAEQIPSDFKLAINISPQQFKLGDFIEYTEQYLSDYQVNPHNITLEVTEGVLLDNVEAAKEKITTLNQRGITFSIDDFGTGYSSLAYLKRLPVQELKIDKSFVRDILQDESDAALVETIINLATRFHLTTVAEGVETEAHFEQLIKMRCNSFQGYLFSKPVPMEVFSTMLSIHEIQPQTDSRGQVASQIRHIQPIRNCMQ
jgi:EAL domain-containing protein (putative c-di-GMP-specific phosphodiesterase class I)